VVETPSHHTVFLYLNLQIIDKKIHTNTYQKALNLYLYIPPRSAHPPSCLKGLVTREFRHYWLQSNAEDFTCILSKFINHLTERGHDIKKLIPLLEQTALVIESNNPTRNPTGNPSTLSIHWDYHPNGLNRSDIRSIYNNTLQQVVNYNKITIAISRPKNLQDILSRSPLDPPKHLNIQNTINRLTTRDQITI
jgi:hypothetical protein